MTCPKRPVVLGWIALAACVANAALLAVFHRQGMAFAIDGREIFVIALGAGVSASLAIIAVKTGEREAGIRDRTAPDPGAEEGEEVYGGEL